MKELPDQGSSPLAISDDDVIEAMKTIPGYIDITPGDFKEVYQAAYALAMKRMFDTLTAEAIMTKSVLLVDEVMELVDAAALLAESQVSGAPVVGDNGVIVGVVSEKDFLREMGVGEKPSFMRIATHCLNNQGCMIGRLRNKTVADIMTRPPITGTPGMTVGAISALFAERQINRLPIIDAERRPVGIVTRTDLAHSFHTCGRRPKP
ncbi:MAG: CBS domain-containing protein [Desulfobacterales bacterium GWB2_56_26]|nr:MAG: CBS domain-containing protein [Desulfobacterales bacterium GWB2_56_26]